MIVETATIAMVAKPLVEKIVMELVSPKIKQFADWCKGKYKEEMIPTAEHFQKYLEESYDKYSWVNTLVFHNSRRLLKDIYVVPTLVSTHLYHVEYEYIKIDSLPVELIKHYKRLLITDTAGMGKTTIMKRMFIDLIDQGLDKVGIPIFIELNRLNKDCSILSEIQKKLSSLSKVFDNVLLLKFIQTGGFIFFLDGFDEISSSDKNVVTQDIQDFISKAGSNNYFIMASRHEDDLVSFGDFQSFRIQPLRRHEAFELLGKYDLSENKELSSKLVELLISGHYNSINEYLVNPLLVSLLFTAYDYNRSIPFEKHRFYEIVFEAYFEKHDSSKPLKTREKYSGLNIDGFDRVLRYLGYDSLIKTGVQFNKDTILQSIKKAKVFCGNSNFSESDFLKDLTLTVPLFRKEGTDYKWVHKSLLEFFAARFIYHDAKEHQDDILKAIYNSENNTKYINMLDLYYDIDPKGFSKNITLSICKKYVQFYDKNRHSLNIDKTLIEQRIQSLFNGNYAFLISDKGYEHVNSLFENSELGIQYKYCRNKRIYFQNYSINLYCITLSSKDVNKILSLLSILIIKNPSLFNKVVSFERTDDVFVRDSYYYKIFQRNSYFKQNKVYIINMKTGYNSYKIYDAINYICNPYYCLDYSSCKKEITRILNEIEERHR